MENFKISGVMINHYPASSKRGYGEVTAAHANYDVGDEEGDPRSHWKGMQGRLLTESITISSRWTGIKGAPGTSTNMNANEVLANIALEMSGQEG
ncbi:MAG: hypothetical protein IPM83_03735 [Ignavibacteria bacterium]|nr:hypothetical protein [Ignavibacteria bacterium]